MQADGLKNSFFFILLTISTVAFFWLLIDFIMPLFWATTFSILFFPIFRKVKRVLKGRDSMSSLLTITFILLLVILPAFLIGLAVTKQVTVLYDQYLTEDVNVQQSYQYVEDNLPGITGFLEEYGMDMERLKSALSSSIVASSRFIASKAYGIGGNVIRFFILLFIMIYLLFFFLRDGERLVETFIHVLPLGDQRERLLFSKFSEVLRATIKGTFVIGIIQGTLGGLVFWILGIQSAILWGVLMIILSILPAVGAAIVWVPAAIILIISGSWIKGVILLVVGILLIGMIDNFLRPVLVGRDTKMPDYLILLSTLGGLTLFGISGFIIGPVIAVLFLTVWQIFMQDYSVKEIRD